MKFASNKSKIRRLKPVYSQLETVLDAFHVSNSFANNILKDILKKIGSEMRSISIGTEIAQFVHWFFETISLKNELISFHNHRIRLI